MKKILLKAANILLIAATILTLLAGCRKEPVIVDEKKESGPYPVTVTDIYGIKVTIEKKPERIVALAPSIVEILYELGLGDNIVAVTDFCDYPAEAKDKPKVGGFNGVNIEKIIEAKPDLILLDTASKEVFQKLTELNLKVMVTEAKTIAEIPETFLMLGRATGTEDKARAMADGLSNKINQVREKAKEAKKIKTYYVMYFGKDGNWTAGRGTFISELISIAAGENIADDVESWNQYSIEKIMEKDPEIILISGRISQGDASILDKEIGYKDTSAVKNKKVIPVNDDLIERPGPRIVEGLELIAKSIHPEIFSK